MPSPRWHWERAGFCSLALGWALSLCWVWQRADTAAYQWKLATDFAVSPVTKELTRLGRAGHTAFALEPLWTFAAGQVQTPPELTILPRKRFWCGEISNAAIANILHSNHVDSVAVDESVASQPGWTNLLADYAPAVHDGGTVLFERRALHPKPVALQHDVRDAFLHNLGF